MDTIIDAIRAALAKDATPEARAAGVTACRSVLATLEPKQTSTAPAFDPVEVAKLVTAARSLPPDQLLDVAIAKLRGALPVGTEVPPVKPFTFHRVHVPKRG
jgi:hypothetical protein